MSFARGKYSRTNYRLTGGKEDTGELGSIIIAFRVTTEHDSATGNVVTFSTGGYGRAAWAIALLASEWSMTLTPPVDRVNAHCSAAADSSLVYMSVAIADRSAGSLAVTVSLPWNVLALIASR